MQRQWSQAWAYPLGLTVHCLLLCLQLFLDDSKMKNFVTCFKGTAAPLPSSLKGPGGLTEAGAVFNVVHGPALPGEEDCWGSPGEHLHLLLS